jgi:hypothetical protein
MAECGGSPEQACATAFAFGRFRAQIKAGLRTKNREGVGWLRAKTERGRKEGAGWARSQFRLENWKTSSFFQIFYKFQTDLNSNQI